MNKILSSETNKYTRKVSYPDAQDAIPIHKTEQGYNSVKVSVYMESDYVGSFII